VECVSEFNLGDSVTLNAKENDCIPGIIHEICFTINGKHPVYEVHYWNNGIQINNRFYGGELSRDRV